MGDIADSIFEHYVPGDDDDFSGPPMQYYITCRCCKEENLVWMKTRFGWRLFNLEEKIHDCPANPLPDYEKWGIVEDEHNAREAIREGYLK